MARIRSVKPELCTSETMAQVSAEAERTFVRLWTHCDDEGRCRDNTKLLKAALFPLHDDVTAESIDRHLWELSDLGLIVRYSVAREPFLHVPSWREHQKPQKRLESKLPAPDTADDQPIQAESRRTTRLLPEDHGPVGEGRVGVDVVGGVAVADPSPVSGLLTTAAPESALDVEQQVNRAVGIVAALRSQGGDNPPALAASIGKNFPDHERAELRDLIEGGMDARDAAAAVADPLRGLTPTTGTPADPEAIARAAEVARKREADTAKALAEMRSRERAPMPDALSRRNRIATVPDPDPSPHSTEAHV